MDRLDELTIFRAIGETGSLAHAARRLRRSPPAVTRALSALEERTGVRLIERTTRRLVLTEAGRELFERSRSLLADYEGAVFGQAAAPVRGLLRVTAPATFGRRHMAPLVSGFLDRYPDVQVELVLNDRNLDMIEERLDAALRIGRLRDSTLVARKVGEVRRVLVASPAYLAARGEPKTPGELEAHDTIFGSLWTGAPEWRFGAEDRATVVRLSPRLLVNDAEAVLYATRAGRGVARLLSYQAADDLAAGTLMRLMVDFEPEPSPVQLVTPSAGRRTPKLRAFLDHATVVLRALPVIHGAESSSAVDTPSFSTPRS
jgi:DNA-binding transcriptional LysR family regulator